LKESDEEIGIQKAVELMHQGATMLNEACPECSSPLFQLKDDVICPHCNKKVIIVADEAEVQELEKELVLSELDQAICTQIANVIKRLDKEDDIDAQIQIGRIIVLWLEALEKLKRIRSQ